jgi:DNA replication licensing factor MCM3
VPFEEALEEVVRNQDPKHLQEGQQLHVGFTGSFGFHRVSPRELLSGFLGTLVQVEGIVTKCACSSTPGRVWRAPLRRAV